MIIILGNTSEYIGTNPMPRNLSKYDLVPTSDKIVDMYQTVGAFIMDSLKIDPNIEKVDIVLQLSEKNRVVRYKCDVSSEYDLVTISHDYEDEEY